MLSAFSLPAGADVASKVLAKYEQPVDKAIDRALVYLAGKQLKDGSFYSPKMVGNSAVSSLSVMAFLAKGHTPGVGPYGQVINRGIDFVLSIQRPNGLLYKRGGSHGPMYSHGTATLMLSEISGMVDLSRQKRVDTALGKALKLILDAQNVPKQGYNRGGWRYKPTSRDSDLSCSAWSLMALRSARNNGAPVPAEAIDRGVKYVLALHCKGGGFGYNQPKAPALPRTGAGLLCLELCGKHGHKFTIDTGQ